MGSAMSETLLLYDETVLSYSDSTLETTEFIPSPISEAMSETVEVTLDLISSYIEPILDLMSDTASPMPLFPLYLESANQAAAIIMTIATTMAIISPVLDFF